MANEITRYTRIGEWIFEVKMVRALKVKEYGEPYTACANLTINGSDLYIDSQMTKNGDDFNRKDFLCFYKFCQQMNVNFAIYDKIKDNERMPRKIEIFQNTEDKPVVQLGRVS